MRAQRIAIVDRDVSRRGVLSRQIFDCGLHCEPYASPAEFADRAMAIDVVIAFDDLDVVARVFDVLSAADLWVPVVLYGANPAASRIVDAVHQGAVDYLDWPVNVLEFLTRFDLLRCGRYAAMLQMAFRCRHITEALSMREQQVLRLIKDGHSNKEMGRTLGISPRTVEIHRSNMMHKMKVANTAEAVSLAIYAELSLPGSGEKDDSDAPG